MLCRQCGATISAELESCGVCHAPNPAPTESARERVTTPADVDREITRLSSAPAAPASDGPVLKPGQQFGRRYSIIRLLGSGGMAVVYQAWDEMLGSAVALKLISVDAGTPAIERRELQARFTRELKLARQVTHPNVVRIHDPR